MKLLLFAAGLLCLMGVARGSDEEQLVRDVVKAFVTDYNNGDFKNAPSYTTDEWVHINPGGGVTRGRDEVLKEVRAIHTNPRMNSSPPAARRGRRAIVRLLCDPGRCGH
jgi:hypothetical protein